MRFVVIWLYSWLLGTAFAGQLRLVVPDTTMVEGRGARIEVRVIDLPIGEEPDLPVEEGLFANFRTRSGSERTINGHHSSQWSFAYDLWALQPGTWQLGPVEIDVEGQRVRSNTVIVDVVPRPEGESEYLRLSTSVSEERPFEGEILVYDLEFLYRGGAQIRNLPSLDMGEFIEEMGVDPNDDPMELRTETSIREERDGFVFDGVRIDVPLRAVIVGEDRIAPALLQATIPVNDPYSRSRHRGTVQSLLWTSPAIDIEVRRLPERGRLDPFSGLVGSYEIRAQLDDDRIELGESLTMDITITGNGRLDGVTLPLPAETDGYRVYDEPIVAEARLVNGAYRSTARVSRVLVPEQSGTLVIEPIELAIFDPETETYRWIRTEASELEVLPGENQDAIQSFSERAASLSTEIMGEDILSPLHDDGIHDHRLMAWLPWLLPLPVGLCGLLFGSSIVDRVRSRSRSPHARRRARLRRLPRDPKARLGELTHLVHEVMAEALGLGSGVVDAESASRLGSEAQALYQDLTRARYAGEVSEDLETRARNFVRRHSK